MNKTYGIIVISAILTIGVTSLPDSYGEPKTAEIILGYNNFVIWKNLDSVGHTVSTEKPIIDSYSGVFGSNGVIPTNGTYSFLFTEPVEFEYFCEPHPWMRGIISVQENRF